MAKHFDNVKVVHADRREGLIRTRLLGAKHATGEVLLFLDSHVEANINYLPPLLGLYGIDCMLSNFACCFGYLLIYSKLTFQKILSGILSECQPV